MLPFYYIVSRISQPLQMRWQKMCQVIAYLWAIQHTQHTQTNFPLGLGIYILYTTHCTTSSCTDILVFTVLKGTVRFFSPILYDTLARFNWLIISMSLFVKNLQFKRKCEGKNAPTPVLSNI